MKHWALSNTRTFTMAGTNFQVYKDFVKPSINSLDDVDLIYDEYQLDQYRDFEDNPWTNLTVFAPDVTEYPGVSSTMSAQEYINMNIRKNTEFLLERGSKSLVVCVGESWVHGETVRTTQPNNDIFCHAMHSTLGARLAHLTNSDLHQHAIPGNCTGLIFQAVEKILHYHRARTSTSYQTIYVALQITDINRDLQTGNIQHLHKHSPTKTFLRACSENKNKCSAEDFYVSWERHYLNYLETMVQDHSDINAKFLIYKNLTPWYGPEKDHNSRLFYGVDNFWLNWLANQCGKEFPACYFLNAGQLDEQSVIWQYVHRDLDWISRELERIDAYQQMASNSGNHLHCSHPFQLGHTMWAEHIAKQAGWL